MDRIESEDKVVSRREQKCGDDVNLGGYAMCAYLIVSFIKLQSKTTKTMRQVLRLLNLNAFEKMTLFELVIGRPIKPPNIDERQLILLGI